MATPGGAPSRPRPDHAASALTPSGGGAGTRDLIDIFLAHRRSLAAGALLLGALLASGFALWPRPAPPPVVVMPTPRATASPAPLIVVHVVGAVASPGVYHLPSDARIEDAISQAGGFTEDADPGSLNLAARLVDGQQVQVKSRAPTAAPAPIAGSEPPSGGKLNLNLASVPELDQLPGLGPVLAQRIVDRRQRLGPYQSVEQLRDEKLVPGPTYERIKDLLTVN